MRIAAKALALAACASIAACAGSSAAPKGWQPMPGASTTWTNGTGPNAQTYAYSRVSFAGSLQDLASQVAIDVVLHERGTRLQHSQPFAACPGIAGLATFKAPGGKTLAEGFAVRDGEAVRVRYVRRSSDPSEASAEQAMQAALCR
ncbi:MAG: hypothetical protein WA814_03085 [Candidatus Baltobacteraceae bacterium]